MMATVTIPPPQVRLPGELFRISLDLYHRMGELGLLQTSDRVVLLDGLLVKKMTKKPRHVTSSQQTVDHVSAMLPAGWYVRKEDPISLSGGPEGADSEPEPDVAVVRGSSRDYTTRHPRAAEIGLIVEVAERSLADDRASLRRYAWARVPCVWIVNLIDDVIEVYSGPSGPTADPSYANRVVYGPGQSITLVVGSAICGDVAVNDILP